MRKYIVIFFLLVISSLFAQGTVTLYPNDSSQGKKWTDIALSSSAEFIFEFSNNRPTRHNFAGSATITTYTDTLATVPITGSITSTWEPLKYDKLDRRWEPAPGVTGQTTFITALNWRTGHSDITYTDSQSIILLLTDGLRVNVTNNDGTQGVRVRVELTISEQR